MAFTSSDRSSAARGGMPAAAFLLAFCLAPFFAAPAAAQGYEGLMEAQSFSSAAGGGSGYDGLVGWTAQQGATNPYGTPPAADLYQFVRGAGASLDEQRDMARQQREEERLRRQQEMMERNRQRVDAIQAQLKAESDARQRRLLEQQQEIMQRLQQQQQQQQQQAVQRRR